jgi:hypothetical protein
MAAGWLVAGAAAGVRKAAAVRAALAGVCSGVHAVSKSTVIQAAADNSGVMR